MIVKKNKIIYVPYPIKGDSVNEYTTNMVKILEKKYEVRGDLQSTINLIDILSTKAIFLNWIENDLDLQMKMLLRLYHFFGTKIVWIFHNKLPHDIKNNDEIKKKMKWIANQSDIIILHSKSSRNYVPNKGKNQKKAIFIPHILYDERKNKNNLINARMKYDILEKDFVFTIFGLVRPYKNIENGIETFIRLNLPNSRLIIAGKPVNVQYAKYIKKLCSENKNIILDLRYIPDSLLDTIINISDVILIPYHDGSSMNSGVMIQAFSKGKTVIAPKICMARDFASEGFFYGYNSCMDNAMKKAYKNGKIINREMGEQARIYMKQHNNEKIVSEQLFSALD
jgi:glycosyltransferase involved in cell wall biosynthesis